MMEPANLRLRALGLLCVSLALLASRPGGAVPLRR